MCNSTRESRNISSGAYLSQLITKSHKYSLTVFPSSPALAIFLQKHISIVRRCLVLSERSWPFSGETFYFDFQSLSWSSGPFASLLMLHTNDDHKFSSTDSALKRTVLGATKVFLVQQQRKIENLINISFAPVSWVFSLLFHCWLLSIPAMDLHAPSRFASVNICHWTLETLTWHRSPGEHEAHFNWQFFADKLF